MRLRGALSIGSMVTFGMTQALAVSDCRAIGLNLPGYTAALVADLPHATYPTMDVDPAGNLLIPAGAAGILKVTPGGAVSTWSSAIGSDIVSVPSGGSYLAASGNCDCIKIGQTDGTFTILLQDGNAWSRLALSAGGTLYAMVRTGVENGIYQIDRITGQASLAITGGPGAYFGMGIGSDDRLYVIEWAPSPNPYPLSRLDGSQLVPVAALPHGGGDITQGPPGVFYVSTAIDLGSGYAVGEIWTVDLASGNTALLARSTSDPDLVHPTLKAVGYDASTGSLYVAEDWKLWAIKKDPTPAKEESWGSVKAQYRR